MTLLFTIVVLLLWMVGGILLIFGTYHLARRVLPPKDEGNGHHYPESIRDLASATGFRIGAFYGILLALLFAQELQGYQNIREGLAREAAAVSQTYFDAGRYGGPSAPVIREALKAYARAVVEVEWPLLSTEQQLSPETWNDFNRAMDAVERLDAHTPAETALRARMLTNMGEMANLRNLRLQHAAESHRWLFLVPSLAGMFLVTIPFFIYTPRRETWVMLGCYGAFAGLVLFFIDGFSNPFDQPLQVSPAPFERLLEGHVGSAPTMTDGMLAGGNG